MSSRLVDSLSLSRSRSGLPAGSLSCGHDARRHAPDRDLPLARSGRAGAAVRTPHRLRLQPARVCTVAVNGINDNTGAAPLYALPTQDQWYKAAFYDPTLGGSGGYYNFATRSDTTPGNVVGPDFNQANHYVTGTGYSLTQSTTLGSVQNYLTDVGAYAGSASAYGTFDQSGNTAEWTDPGPGQTSAFLRGGAWDLASTGNQFNVSEPIGTANYLTGFRLVAAVPEPSGWVLALSAVGAGWWGIRRRFHRREVRPPSGASS